jgi:pimeloyl-ACP methyl ester carboxylesterase
MVAVKRAYGEGPFGQVHYRIAWPEGEASAPPLLCLHQSPKTGRDFEALMSQLGRERVVLAPDTPGYGQSDAPGEPPAIVDYVANIVSFMERLRDEGVLPPGAVDVMGYHTGGVIAAALAANHPALVRRLVFVSLAGFAPEVRAERLSHMHVFATPREDNGNIAALLAIGETLNDPRLGPEWRHLALGEILQTGTRMPWGFRAVYDHDMLADLRTIAQPALVLCPRDDLWDETHANVRLLANARLVEFAEAGNGFLELDTELVAKLIGEFLG